MGIILHNMACFVAEMEIVDSVLFFIIVSYEWYN
jgi:hypothetical protein